MRLGWTRGYPSRIKQVQLQFQKRKTSQHWTRDSQCHQIYEFLGHQVGYRSGFVDCLLLVHQSFGQVDVVFLEEKGDMLKGFGKTITVYGS